MNHTTLDSIDNLVPSDWIVTSLRSVRDALQAEGRDDLALTLSEAIGGLTAIDQPLPVRKPWRPLLAVLAERRIDDGIADDFELTADEWPALGDIPLDVLALSLPAISGGAPEPFVPSESDWDDYFACRHDDETGYYTEADARAAGLPV